jgi:hypothetical protein
LWQQGRKAFFKKNNANPKTVYTKLLTPPASIQVIYRLSAHRPSGRQRQGRLGAPKFEVTRRYAVALHMDSYSAQ